MKISTISRLVVKSLIVAFACMLIHIFWCNLGPVWSYIFSGDSSLTMSKSFFSTFTFVIFGSFFLAALFSISVLLGRVVTHIMNLMGALYTYYFLHFGVQMSDEIMVTSLFFVESNDITSSFDWTVFIYVQLIFIPAFLAVNAVINKVGLTKKTNFGIQQFIKGLLIRSSSALISIVLLLSVLGIVYVSIDPTLFVYRLRTVAEQAMPSYLLSRKSNIQKLASANSRNTKLQDYEEYGFSYPKDDSKEPLKVVLIIGESLRSDRLGINGYNKDTTPHMDKMTNLFSFKDVLSCSTTTAVSLPCMLTNELQSKWIQRFSTGAFKPKYSIAKVFNNQGFETKWLSAANKDYGIYINKDFHGSKDVMLSNELRRKYISKENDFGDALLVKAMDIDTDKDTLFVLGTMGSHREYFSRYPKHMAKFKPDVGKSLENINNAYDNTVVYFDQLIFDLTNKLKDKNAILFYISDHGESLGENGVFLHGAPYDSAPDEQILVPMITWMSDKYVKNNPIKHKNIQQWLERNNNKVTSLKHDHLFHSLLDCAGLESSNSGIDNELSVCSPH